MRMRKKKNLVPRMERCAAQLIRDPYEHRGHWRDLMPQARELRVELGCGKGRFTHGTAAAEPDVLFIAIEMVPDAMVVAMERCVNDGLTNVFFVDANADQLPVLRPRRGGPDLRQLLRSLAQQAPCQAPPDSRQLPEAVPSGAENGRSDPLQD